MTKVEFEKSLLLLLNTKVRGMTDVNKLKLITSTIENVFKNNDEYLFSCPDCGKKNAVILSGSYSNNHFKCKKCKRKISCFKGIIKSKRQSRGLYTIRAMTLDGREIQLVLSGTMRGYDLRAKDVFTMTLIAVDDEYSDSSVLVHDLTVNTSTVMRVGSGATRTLLTER